MHQFPRCRVILIVLIVSNETDLSVVMMSFARYSFRNGVKDVLPLSVCISNELSSQKTACSLGVHELLIHSFENHTMLWLIITELRHETVPSVTKSPKTTTHLTMTKHRMAPYTSWPVKYKSAYTLFEYTRKYSFSCGTAQLCQGWLFFTAFLNRSNGYNADSSLRRIC